MRLIVDNLRYQEKTKQVCITIRCVFSSYDVFTLLTTKQDFTENLQGQSLHIKLSGLFHDILVSDIDPRKKTWLVARSGLHDNEITCVCSRHSQLASIKGLSNSWKIGTEFLEQNPLFRHSIADGLKRKALVRLGLYEINKLIFKWGGWSQSMDQVGRVINIILVNNKVLWEGEICL